MKEGIKAWFAEAANYISRVPGGAEALQDPKRIFNTDESGFVMDAGTGCVKTVLVPRGACQVQKRACRTKEQVTINAACNAAGDFMWPFLCFPGKIMSCYIGYRDFPEAFYGTTENGWMTMQAWNDWLYHFNEFVNSRQIQKPVVLFVDHYGVHVNREAAEFCHDKGIILYTLLRNATFVLQPFDIGIFSEMKMIFKMKCRDFIAENSEQVVNKVTFPGIFKRTWQEIANADIACTAFRHAGIFPFDAANVEYE